MKKISAIHGHISEFNISDFPYEFRDFAALS